MFKVGGIFIPVTDLKRSKDWYSAVLGLTKIDEWQENGEDYGADFVFEKGTTPLTLIKVEKPQPTEFTVKGKDKNVYYNFEVADIDEAYNHFTKHGVETTEIHDFGPMKGFDFFDLDGNPFSIVSEEG
ncbi:VOC family protein [Filobacillus milosensis]|uniref:VOC family protein n=1 Tax=Filobacillus milosensis TaxID=94137 RepID=A0A4Y8ILF5_9BACI|nr:VOC family protein [Filobacillus milosensis]TFB22121.1 VOC family protein [Filobacillus milosensis]